MTGSTTPQEALAQLSSRDLVLVGDGLWDVENSKWVLGGEQHLLRALARLSEGHGFKVWACQPHPRWEQWEGDGIQWIGVPPGRRSGWRRVLWNGILHRHLSFKSRVVYSYAELASPWMVPGAIIWQHGVSWDGRSPERQFRSRRQNKKVLNECGAVVCVDTNFPNVLATSLRNLDSLHSHCVYIPNFPTAEPSEFLQKPTASLRVVYVRRFGKGRGTDLMVEAARRLWDQGFEFELELAGYSTNGSEEANIRSRLAPELTSGRCTFGPIPHDRIHEVYAHAHVAVVPTRSGEGTSLACLEAFAFGIPVIATWVGGLPNLVQDNLNGLLVAPVVQDITHALGRVLRDPRLRARLAEGALASAQRFSRKRWESQVSQLFQQLNWIPSAES